MNDSKINVSYQLICRVVRSGIKRELLMTLDERIKSQREVSRIINAPESKISVYSRELANEGLIEIIQMKSR